MKKVVIATLIMLLLSACMSNTEENSKKENTDGTGSITFEETGITEDTLQKFPEYKTFKKNIDLQTYHAQMKDESNEKRVIVFLNDKQKEIYKSVYLKGTKRVKIIKLSEDEVMVNKVLS
ncbi:hypothetical protein GLW20_12605 [Virgibacillus halodenitrificans]|nr:hypothetical protein [Virgibacillus halodenitrificans]